MKTFAKSMLLIATLLAIVALVWLGLVISDTLIAGYGLDLARDFEEIDPIHAYGVVGFATLSLSSGLISWCANKLAKD